MIRPLVLLAAVILAVAAAEPIPVITGNTVVHDITSRIGGDRFIVSCLLEPGVDPHAYQPVPDDVRRLAAARMVIINGLGFEGWFEALAKEAPFSGQVMIATAGITPLTMTEACAGGHGHDHAHGHEVLDPHAYNSVRQGVRYAENIRDALVRADPSGAESIRQRAATLIDELRRLDSWATAQLAVIPKGQRKIITNHGALGYFAHDYGFEVMAPDSAMEDSQPSAREIAAIIAFIRTQGVKGVFLEHGKNPKLIEQIAAESGVRVAADLYLDGVGPSDGPAASYVGMFRSNVEAIVSALR